MPRINILSPHVADLIAAGEVVERPASAVKELVENAIDAGARNITVEFSAGGAELIRVTDDGCGMSPEDAGVAFLRHATSKLADERGLEAIGTLGFRGEALAAIGSVSQIELTTRERGAAEGTYMTLSAGDIQEMRPAGAPEGTSIAVRGLFFNTPARRKFLKSDRAEGAACLQAAMRCALGRPDVSIRCIRDGREEFFTPGDGRAESAVYALLGRETALAMLPVAAGSPGGVQVSGFTGSPAAGRGSRSSQYFFVNGRHIKSQLLQAAVEQAYRGTLLTGKFPSCVIYVTLSSAAVDVNVHPAKTEVKFSDERSAFNAVHYAVLGALEEKRPPAPAEEAPAVKFASGAASGEAEASPGPGAAFPRWTRGGFATQRPAGAPDAPAAPPAELRSPVSGYQTRLDLAPDAVLSAAPRSAPRPEAPPSAAVLAGEDGLPEAGEARVIGEALGLYILVEYAGSLVIIDKHAAHERMLYDSLVSREAAVHTQSLLEPVTLSPSPDCAAALEANSEALAALGFEYEPFGGGVFILRSVPAQLSPGEAAAALEEAGDALARERVPDIANARAELLKTVACKAAIKAGPSSSPEELRRLAAAVCSGEVRYCPHGRPVAWALTRRDLDRQFKRIV